MDKKADDASVRQTLAGLDSTEREFVIERGLTPVGRIESGVDIGRDESSANQRPMSLAAVAPGEAIGTFWCSRKSAAGITMYRYNSRWHWAWGRHGNIRRANHQEWASSLAPGWDYRGDKYLWPHGAIGTQSIGRATQGHFAWQPLGTYLWSSFIINDNQVFDSGRYWHTCS